MSPKFSLIIPTYNEERIIQESLQHILVSTERSIEVLVVDDSTDRTPYLVAEIAEKDDRVRIIRPSKRLGRSGARNLGIAESKGNILCILNADVLMHSTFLSEIGRHYDNGYESVTVFVKVKNIENMYARYVELWTRFEDSIGEYELRKVKNCGIYWSEGFSVTKKLALKTSLFPTGGDVHIEAGEDVRFVDELRNNNCKGIIDLEISIEHIAPDSFSEFWKVRKGRGRGTPQLSYYVAKSPIWYIFGRSVLKCIRNFFMVIALVPQVIYAIKVVRFSPEKSTAEYFKMAFLRSIELITYSIGEFEAIKDIVLRRL